VLQYKQFGSFEIRRELQAGVAEDDRITGGNSIFQRPVGIPFTTHTTQWYCYGTAWQFNDNVVELVIQDEAAPRSHVYYTWLRAGGTWQEIWIAMLFPVWRFWDGLTIK